LGTSYGDKMEHGFLWTLLVVLGGIVLASSMWLAKYDLSNYLSRLWGPDSYENDALSTDQTTLMEDSLVVDFRELEPIEPMPKPQTLLNYCDESGANCVDMYPWNQPKDKWLAEDQACERGSSLRKRETSKL